MLGYSLKEMDQEHLRAHSEHTFLHLLILPLLWSTTF